MTNAERAAKLAEIFGWKIVRQGFDLYEVPFGTSGREFGSNFFADDEIALLPWLLRELPKRNCRVELWNDVSNLSFWKARVVTKVGELSSYVAVERGASPLLALVDAVIAAEGKA